MRARAAVLLCLCLFLLSAIGGFLAADAVPGSIVLIEGVPAVKQKPDFCGEACAAMYLQKLGRPFDQDDVFDQSGLDPLEGRGCYTRELAVALRRIGFKIGDVWGKARAETEMERQWEALHGDLRKGIPSIVCMRYDDRPGSSEHFRLVLGFDAKRGEVIYHEPAEENGGYRRMPKARFLSLWPLKYDPEEWTVIRLRLEPGDMAANKKHEGFTQADYAQHILELRKKLPRGFTMVLEPPFVVLGDEAPAVVKERSRNTVRWAVERLKQEYFEKDPLQILDIWLFKDRESYERHALEIFGVSPSTPFGYYSHENRALVMNISTGGGTLVHEIVHPFMQSSFPACPSWFNEGLASLYEQSGEKNGRIYGHTNWRLEGLQEAIRKGRVPAFKSLLETSTDGFYSQDRGVNYAEARYLCHYLQEKGLLVKFFREFVAHVKEDSTGYATLKKVLGRDDMEGFQKEWEDFVLKLAFP
jgi:hypothetical protein